MESKFKKYKSLHDSDFLLFYDADLYRSAVQQIWSQYGSVQHKRVFIFVTMNSNFEQY